MDRFIRIGKVSSIDYANGMVKVTYPDLDNSVTDDLPFLTFNQEYEMPCINDDVLVVHLSNGQAAGICLGTYWNAQNPPHGSGKGYYRKDFNAEVTGESYLEGNSGAMNFHAKGLNVSLDGSLSVDADSVTFTDSSGSITLAEIIHHIK